MPDDDQTAEPEPDTEPVEPEGEEADPAEDDPADARLSKARREARALRTRLRTAEGERDALAARLEAFNIGQAERWASSELIEPRDLFVPGVGVTIPELLNEDGDLDEGKVKAAAVKVAAARPHWRRARPPAGKPVPRLQGGGGPAPDDTPSWGEVLKRG